ncbi:hypothetical protein [Corallococcus sp. AB030]|uniref:hypothetical protein n=1 Tax=Corallococcus sp. AB030 TaxID=2316716 RepID=UPI0018F63EC4|nr:hypothetical protein [Corallococcus sp. AB030]NRD53131.1 hypothetical protein [Corallococcus exiguus]
MSIPGAIAVYTSGSHPVPPVEQGAMASTQVVRSPLESALHWVDTQQRPDGALSITFRVVTFEEEVLTQVEEQEWNVVPPSARLEPERVRHFLGALVEVVSEDSRRLESSWISERDSLRRSGARQRESFARILRAHVARDFGSDSGD